MWEAWEREWERNGRVWERERERVGENEREWGERERMWERIENVSTDLDLSLIVFLICLFDLILNFPSTIFQLNMDRSLWVEPVLS